MGSNNSHSCIACDGYNDARDRGNPKPHPRSRDDWQWILLLRIECRVIVGVLWPRGEYLCQLVLYLRWGKQWVVRHRVPFIYPNCSGWGFNQDRKRLFFCLNVHMGTFITFSNGQIQIFFRFSGRVITLKDVQKLNRIFHMLVNKRIRVSKPFDRLWNIIPIILEYVWIFWEGLALKIRLGAN